VLLSLKFCARRYVGVPRVNSTVRFSKPILLIGLILLSGLPLMAQRHFYLEDRFNFKAKIPRDVSNLLLQEIKRRHLCCLNGLSDISPWFSAARIDLGGPGSALILASDHGCLNGADNNWFWVFLKRQKRYRMVLTGGTLSVDVVRSTSFGLHNIETNVATANTLYTNVYKFNGSVYKPRMCSETAIFPDNQKPKRLPCRSQ
jgi:hypothetical protein